MEILTLLKANIRNKKGSFVSIIILMFIVSMAFTIIFSLQDNCTKGIEAAFDSTDSGDVALNMTNVNFSEELIQKVKKHPMVENVDVYPAIESWDMVCGENSYNNGTWLLLKYNQKYRMLNSDLSGYADETPKLKRGEIYVTQGVLTSMECNVGDKIKLKYIASEGECVEFVIKGTVVEPSFGASTIGWKRIFISDEDFDEMLKKSIAVDFSENPDNPKFEYTIDIYKKSDCTLTDNQFRRQLNLDTGIIDLAYGSLTRSMSVRYTNLFPEVVLSILSIFMVFLIVIVLIVMVHSISTSIEMDYVSLGMLKSQGFSKGKIRSVFILQYLAAQLLGIVLGVAVSFPLIKLVGDIFQPITAIPTDNSISIIKSILSNLIILVISALFIFFITRKVGNISPVRAISGSKNEIYFDSRIKAPIFKQGLSASLALRQFTSSKRRYIGTIIITAILVFFMMSANLLGNLLTSKSALDSMGFIYADCEIYFDRNVDDKTLEEVEKNIEKIAHIEKKYYILANSYFSINGEELLGSAYKNPEVINATKGRAPIYNNEIVITEMVAEEMSLKIGDTVTVSSDSKKADFIISGFYQSIDDAGMCFAMSNDGSDRLGYSGNLYAGYSLANSTKGAEIEEAIKYNFGDDILDINADIDNGIDIYQLAVDVIKALIYVLSVVFSIVVIYMVCSKAFLQEKIDIGIYKALGFTSKKLRLQFALRFTITAFIGSIFGTVFSILFSARVMNLILRSIGITNMAAEFTPATIIVPIVVICLCFFIFSYFTSKKIRRVEIKELITE